MKYDRRESGIIEPNSAPCSEMSCHSIIQDFLLCGSRCLDARARARATQSRIADRGIAREITPENAPLVCRVTIKREPTNRALGSTYCPVMKRNALCFKSIVFRFSRESCGSEIRREYTRSDDGKTSFISAAQRDRNASRLN